MTAIRQQYRLVAVSLLLVLLHFALGPWLGDRRIGPDLLLLALLVYAVRARPGPAAVAGFIVGLLADAMTVVAFGSNALAHTVVAYLAAWGKAVFFAENLLVNAGIFFAGTWLRDLLALWSGGYFRDLFWQLAFWSIIKAITTALAGVGVLILFRRWLDLRLTR